VEVGTAVDIIADDTILSLSTMMETIPAGFTPHLSVGQFPSLR
jgi:hypothetical protein